MASDSDGSTSSAVVLNSIREKLVEYKESLLRQLVDEREAALAASNEQEREDVEEEQAEISAAEKKMSPPVEQQAQAEAEVEVIADDLKPVDDVESGVRVVESPVETEATSVAAAVEPVEKPSPAKATEDEVVLKKRRLAEAEESAAIAHKDGSPVKKAKRSKAKTLRPEKQNVDSSNEPTSEKDEQSSMMVDATGEQQTLPVGTPYRVVRTSVPPNKYLMQKRREEEASDREALGQPVLRSSTPGSSGLSTCNGATGVKRPASIHRSSSSSADVVNAEFERRLRESVSLRREVNQRCVSVTRKRQLPRLPTPARDKSHWDFLLEEMKWMATDFAQERNWKRVMQRRLVADVLVAQNAESIRQEQENRQIARGVALQVSAFWRTMERIAARSRVRFEAAGTESSSQGDADDPMLGDHRSEDDGNRGKNEEHTVAAVAGDILSLKYHTIDVAAGKEIDAKGEGKGATKADTVLKAAKSHMSYIVTAGKRARSAMSSSLTDGSIVGDKSSCSSLREAAFRDLQARCTALQAKGGPTIILAAFQLLALRWMLELYSSGLNIFLNDQLGMGKAATIVAFLSLIEIVSFQKQQLQSQEENPTNTTTPETLSTGPLIGPHLILVSDEELHKWRYYLRIWHPDRRIQLYDGVGSSVSCRKQQQREWKIKPRAHAHKSEDDFLIAPPNHDGDDDLDDDERAEPVYCVLCPVNAFYEDREAFLQFNHWQMVVVENEHGGHFDDPACVTALQQLRQQQRRVLCNGQPIENWKNTALRLQYAEFMVREAPRLESDSGSDSSQHRVETWPVQDLLVERASVGEVMQLYGKSSSVRALLWKATSQQEDTSQHMSALLLALSCLSLRRVRSEVEPQLGKIEEISVSCQPSPSQKTQYRNALSGFGATLDTSGGREERLGVWLQLLLRLREICNCVDIVNDLDKLGHADLRLLTSCSAKLEALEPLLRRLAVQEGKKVVVYCQFNAMLPILELFLSLLDIHFVRVTGSVNMQRRALCHFADRPVVRVALVSTRLSMSNGRWAASVFGGEAIIVVDSDWNATCDAKLRASWAKMAVGGADTLPVYRLHCENTVEASLLRVGASLTEKVFGEMNPQELLAVPSDMALSMAIEKPSWWSSTATSSGGNGLSNSGTIASLSSVAQQVEKDGKYCGGLSELEMPLVVHNVDLDAEEHLLLANTDELTPVEWYAVNYVHGVTDKKHQHRDKCKTVERDVGRTEEESGASWDDNSTLFHSDQCSFEEMAASEVNRQWQDGDATSQLFYKMESGCNGLVDENTLEKLFMQMRMEGMETHFDVYRPPQPPLPEGTPSARLSSEAGPTVDNQMTFRVAYRVPAPPPPQPQPGKSKVEHGVGQHGDLSKLKSSKKQRTSAAAMSAARAGMAPGASSANSTAASAGVKRKLESQLGGIKSGPLKEQRVDLEGIPVPDVSEFADDDFWGDTNLDALDSAEWDDPALSGILGAGVGTGNGASSTASSSGTASSGAGVSATLGGSGAGAGAHGEAGHSKTGSQKGFKKSKNATGRARKSSMSSDSGRDAWGVHDDIVLKKLFDLYGANWTLIAQVFNSATAVSRFVCKKRSPRQCYDRYGKIISGSISTSATAPGVTTATSKDSKSSASLKAQRAAAAASVAAAQLTPVVLDARIGLPHTELLLTFPLRHSLPGLPPPSIIGATSLVEMTLALRKKQTAVDAADKKGTTTTQGGGLDDLKSIKTSFDAIIQCMKHKTSPPPIPIPVGTGGTGAASTTATTSAIATADSADLGTKASLTAASAPPSQVPVTVSTTPTKANATKASVSPLAAAKATPVVVPPPHKSHTDMISLLPTAVLGPDEVIKRSKEAAVVAVQAAAAVASVGRDGSPLSASADVMLGAGSGFGASVSSSMPRRSHAASLSSEMSTVGVMAPSALPPTVVGAGAASSGAPPQSSGASDAAAWGGELVHGLDTNGLSAGTPMNTSGEASVPGTSGSELPRNGPMPVTTSTLLHVLDRMPEIKNKIQSILNRTDCSESQKVAMIARLLSNTNAINNTNALGAAPPMASAAATANSSVVLSALTDATMLNSSDMLIDTETPIPMPASLGAPSPPNVATSSAVASQGQFQPPASSQP